MQDSTTPLVREIVLVGGGHTHALVLRRWGMQPVPGVRLTLVNPGPEAPYSGMLPGHVAGHYGRDALMIDLVRLARFAGARLILDRARGIDREARRLILEGGRRIPYDTLSIDIGVTSEMPQIPGFSDHALPAKPLDSFAEGWEAFCADPPAAPRVAVIGGGVAGVELALAAHHRLQSLGTAPEVTILERGRALAALAPSASVLLRRELERAGIALREGAGVAEVARGAVRLETGESLASDLVIGAGGARPHPWLAESGLETRNGFLVVDEYLRSVTDRAIYAAGDCTHFAAAPRPKAGVFAVRAAPVLGYNLRADAIGHARRPFRPQKDYLKLVSLGAKTALGEKSGFHISGPWVWRWKDSIDQRFMDRFRRLPAMPETQTPKGAAKGVATELSGPAPCGGCGAKLGRTALAGALAGLPRTGRDDLETGAGDDAAVLRVGGKRQVVTTDHLRAFTLDPALMARVTALHAMGDVWAMGAAPQAALASVTLPRMQAAMQGDWLEEIMAAAGAVFAEHGAEIVGGHSTQGSELTIGFTVTGLLDRAPLTLADARPGDALILTRGIGSGVLLAAEMAHAANGRDIAALWETLSQSQSRAAEILARDAHAMTDVTGFGLAGHLMAICDASGLAATLQLGETPLLPGAEALSAKGIASTLAPENRAALQGRISGAEGPRGALLFDPQTAGGFLAALPVDAADRARNALGDAGFPAAIIGELREGYPFIEVV